jgi:signal transduction histidine kinase
MNTRRAAPAIRATGPGWDDSPVRVAAARLSVVITFGLVLRVWAAFGTILLPGSEVDPVQVLADRALAFGFYVLWIPVLAITYRRDPQGRMWKLILLSFAMDCWWVLQFLHNPFAGIGWTIGSFTQPLAAAVLLHMVLAFPSGRLRDRTDLWLVGISYTIVIPIQLLRYMVYDPLFPGCGAADTWCASNVFLVARNDDLAFLLGRAGYLAPVLAVLGSVEIISHWQRASTAGRRALAPFAFGMPLVFGVLGIIWLAASMGPSEISDFVDRYKLLDLTSFLTPALFLVGVLRVRLARGSLAELALELGRGVPLGGLRDALARTLRDPTLQLAFAAPTGNGLVDGEGRPFDIEASGDRSATRLEHDGSLVAVLVHDPAIDHEDRGLVEAVGSVARLALENERLSAQVRAQLEEVRASRQRIVEAGDAERRRVERDLHDGAQQRLVALAMRLEAARGHPEAGEALIDATAAELAVAIAEVRQLARGLHPAILSEAGLTAAVESLAERTPIPVEVHGDERRYPDRVEATAYFVVAEALTNVARYASATHATVTIRGTGSELLVEVRDDGLGGADPNAGSGLRGLGDRVAAAGGTFAVESPPGEGTTVRAVIPVVEASR